MKTEKNQTCSIQTVITVSLNIPRLVVSGMLLNLADMHINHRLTNKVVYTVDQQP